MSAQARPESSNALTAASPLLQKSQSISTYTSKALHGIAPLFVLLFGVLGLMYFEKLPVLTSLYVIVQIVTTIGYGDFTMTSDGAKLFLSLYAVLVLVVLAFYMSEFVDFIVKTESDFLRKHMRAIETAAGEEITDDMKSRNQLVAMCLIFMSVLLSGIVFFRYLEHCTCSYGAGAQAGCDDSTFEKCVATKGFVKGWIDSFYMAIITLTTVGFGDYQPRSMIGRSFGIGWMIIGVGTTASFVSLLTTTFLEHKKKKHYANMDLKDIDESTFKVIDKDNSGFLSRGEFINYTLVKYGLVDEKLIDMINAQYDSLDAKNENKVSYSAIANRQRDKTMGPA